MFSNTTNQRKSVADISNELYGIFCLVAVTLKVDEISKKVRL